MKALTIIKVLLSIIMLIMTINGAMAIDTCFNTTSANISRLICFEADSGLYQQNIGLWEGQNDKYGVYVSNPDDQMNQNWFTKFVNKLKGLVSDGKIDISKMGDNTKFVFQDPEDFYNLAQQSGALGNATLFTQREINQEIREKTTVYTGKVIDWSFILILVIVEMLKIFIDIAVFLLVIYAIFRLIPWALNMIKKIVFRFMVGGKEK